MSSWEEIGQKWQKAQRMGWEAIQAAMDVGEALTEKQIECRAEGPEGNKVFIRHAEQIGLSRPRVSELTRLALHRQLIEEQDPLPDSMRKALAMLPKVPRKVGEKQLQLHKDEADKYESFAKESAKKQAVVLAKKRVKVELERLQNQAHEAVTSEMKALRQQLEKERKRVGELMAETEERRQFYQDLTNKRMNGFDAKAGLKVLKQALHPDRESPTPAVRKKAMKVLEHFDAFFAGL